MQVLILDQVALLTMKTRYADADQCGSFLCIKIFGGLPLFDWSTQDPQDRSLNRNQTAPHLEGTGNLEAH